MTLSRTRQERSDEVSDPTELLIKRLAVRHVGVAFATA